MQDNGLLYKYDKVYNMVDGIISLKHGINCKEVKDTFGARKLLVRKGLTSLEPYYFKCCDKLETDSEVLLSQVYAKAGFDTAIYTPAVYNNHFGRNIEGVISNDVADEEFMKTERFDHLSDIASGTHLSKEADYYTFKLLEQRFTKDAVRELIKFRLFDTASYNADRHCGNYMVKQDETGIIGGFTLYDYGSSGHAVEFAMRNVGSSTDIASIEKHLKMLNYPSSFETDCSTRVGLINHIKHNETINHYTNPQIHDACRLW